MWRSLTTLSAIICAAGCQVQKAAEQGFATGAQKHLFDAATAIQDEWQHIVFKGATEYRIVVMGNHPVIRARGQNSASALMRTVLADPYRCQTIEWLWRTEKIQPSADIRTRDREDVAASLFVLFGDPGEPFNPTPVPTLRYSWTNQTTDQGVIVDSPYLPGTVRSIVVRSGGTKQGKWLKERRNLVRDFVQAFGHPPKDSIHGVALFTDNDQTREPAEAYYAWARLLCD